MGRSSCKYLHTQGSASEPLRVFSAPLSEKAPCSRFPCRPLNNPPVAQNSVDAESDLVTLGGDPYSDYSLSGTPHIMPYNSDPADEYWNPARASHSPDEDDKGGLSDLDGMAAVPPELEPFGPGIGDPCDPYWA